MKKGFAVHIMLVVLIFIVGISSWCALDIMKTNQAKDAEIASLTKTLAEKTASVPAASPATQTAEAKPSAMTIIGTYKITPKDLTLQEAVAAGKYDWVNPSILSVPEFQREPAVMSDEVVLVQFGVWVSLKGVLEEMSLRGLRPANIWELLAIGTERPDLQRSGLIIALGSSCVVAGEHVVPSLEKDGSLSLRILNGMLSSEYRFLAVRK